MEEEGKKRSKFYKNWDRFINRYYLKI